MRFIYFFLKVINSNILKSTNKVLLLYSIKTISQFFTVITIAITLIPHDLGIFTATTATVVLLSTISTLGTHTLILKEVSRDRESWFEIFSYALPTTILTGSILLIPFLYAVSFLVGKENLSFSGLVLLGITELVLQPVTMLISAKHQAYGHILKSQFIIVLPVFVRTLFVLFLLLSENCNSLSLYFIIWSTSSLISLFAALHTIKNDLKKIRNFKIIEKKDLHDSIYFSIINMTTLGPSEIDKAIASRLLPLEIAGLYSITTRISGIIMLPIIAVSATITPVLFKERSLDIIKKISKTICLAALIYGSLLGFIIYTTAPSILRLMDINHKIIDEIIPWIALLTPALSCRLAAGNIMLIIDKSLNRAIIEAIGIFLILINAIFLVPIYGLNGMGASVLTAETMMASMFYCTILTQKSKHKTT